MLHHSWRYPSSARVWDLHARSVAGHNVGVKCWQGLTYLEAMLERRYANWMVAWYIYSLFFNYSCNNSLTTFFVSVLLFLLFVCVCNGARVVRMDSFQTAVLRDCQYLGTTEEQVRPRGLCRHCRHSLLLFQPPPNTGVRPFIATFLSSFLSFRPFHISCLFIWLGGNSCY